MKFLNKSTLHAELVPCTPVSRYRACALPARVPIERFWTACSARLAGKAVFLPPRGTRAPAASLGPFVRCLGRFHRLQLGKGCNRDDSVCGGASDTP